jgi:type IV pilus assembly protein PilB
VNVIIAQRLARKLCEDCKVEYKIDQKLLDEIKLTRPDIAGYLKLGEKVYKEVGCTKCVSTGYKGRIGLYEVLELKEDLRKIIYEGGTADELLTAARKDGLTLIVEDGMQKIRDGVVSLSELLRVTAISE